MVRERDAVRAMSPYDPPKEGRRGKLRLDFNENTSGCSPRVLAALRAMTAEHLACYPEYAEFRRALARRFRVGVGQVLPTNGTDEGIHIVMEAFVSPGDVVVVPVPTFPMFRFYAEVSGGDIRQVSYRRDLSFPEEEVLAAAPGARVVVIADPNNPTGTGVAPGVIERLAAAAPDTLILVDEAYHEYSGRTALPLIARRPNVVVSRTFSKAYGLAGLRVGCLIGAQEVIAVLGKALSPYSVNQMAVVAATAALEDEGHLARHLRAFRHGKRVLTEGLAGLGISTRPTDANFLLAEFKGRCKEIQTGLAERGILVRDRSGHALTRGSLRITIGTPAQMRTLLKALSEVLAPPAVLFDMDGVLVDVRRSYREAIKLTAAQFAGRAPCDEDVQALKDSGGYTDDWKLTRDLLRRMGVRVSLAAVTEAFQRHYLGSDGRRGLVENEQWLVRRQAIDRLREAFRVGIVTGRPRAEAQAALRSAWVADRFDVVVSREDVRRLKPHPEGLRKAMASLGACRGVYVGDSVDDMAAARAAGLHALGVVPLGADRDRHGEVLRGAGAEAVIAHVDQAEEAVRKLLGS